MHNFAGMERILACKMNYLAVNTDYVVSLSTYEQYGNPIPFSLAASIHYEPMDVVIPSRDKMTLIHWAREYLKARRQFRLQYRQLLAKIDPYIVVCTGYSFQVMDIIVDEARRHRINVIVESHTKGETVTFAYKYSYNPKLKIIFRQWDKYIMHSLKDASCVVTLTKYDVSFWSKYVSRVEIIPNMLTINPVMVKDYRAKRIISAGRYMTEKGFDRLIEAWYIIKESRKNDEQLDGWQLYIYGDGDRTPYQKLVSKYGLEDSVHLEPATDNIAKIFSEGSFYVMSSRYEGFGLVLTEAMSCGLPCISFDCPYGPREIITDGVDGLLIENGNIKLLASAIEYLISDSDLRKTMGEKAAQNISRYGRDFVMPHWIRLFNSI